MASQSSITERAFRIANSAGMDAHASPTIDAAFLSEDIFRTALREAVIEQNFKRTFNLTVAGGEVALPSGVILEQLRAATVINEEDPETPTSYEERYFDFQRAPTRLLNYAFADGNKFHFRESGGDEADFDGDITLTAVALPDIPALLTTAILIPETLADRTSEILAKLIRGIE